ncbi:MAG: hypothetical protein EOO61_22020 [Hymenobacter sp.]|nr:MAG: hypothetical protein EOO61_22020 [Hymenobacter sp.]
MCRCDGVPLQQATIPGPGRYAPHPMNKPDILPLLPGLPTTSSQTTTPKAVAQQPSPVGALANQNRIPPTRLVDSVGVTAYVDPYLFETGYYASRAEYEELSRTSNDRIQLRGDAEQMLAKRRGRRAS